MRVHDVRQHVWLVVRVHTGLARLQATVPSVPIHRAPGADLSPVQVVPYLGEAHTEDLTQGRRGRLGTLSASSENTVTCCLVHTSWWNVD